MHGPDMSIHKALTTKDVSALATFLASPERPAGTLNYHELQGLIFTVASAPELVRPSEWLPLIFDDRDPGYSNPEEAQETIGLILTLYNEINDAILEGATALPADCRFKKQVMANFDEDAPIAQWSRGFRVGHQYLDALWDGYVHEGMDEKFGPIVMTLTFFSSRRLAEAYVAEFTSSDESTRPQAMEQIALTAQKHFPAAVSHYAHAGRSIREARMTLESADRSRPARSTKVGRNEPCPCGSGKKFKKCCGANVH